MKTGYVVSVESIVSEWPHNFYLIDDDAKTVVKMFDTMDELNIYADLHDYKLMNLHDAPQFKNLHRK